MAVINLTKERSKTAIKRPYKALCASLRNDRNDFKSDQCFCSNAHAILQQPIAFCRWANIELNPVKHGSKDAIRFPHGASPSRLNRSIRITGSSSSSRFKFSYFQIFIFSDFHIYFSCFISHCVERQSQLFAALFATFRGSSCPNCM